MYLIRKEKKPKIIDAISTEATLELKLKRRTVTIKAQFLLDALLLKEINPDLDKLIEEILEHLATDEDDSTQTGLLYDELAKQRSMILNKYEKRLSENAVQTYMKKIRFAAFELRKRLMAYNYQNQESQELRKGR